MKRPNVLYIAGYGRSGSTLIEMILGSNEKIYALGELTNFNDIRENNEAKCSCGDLVVNCSFWNRVLKDFGLNKENLTGEEEIIWESIFKNINKEVDYLIDSSKTARNNHLRPIKLAKLLRNEIYMIHIVRDGRGCIQSLTKGSNQKMERGINPKISLPVLRGTLGWFTANLSAHIFQFKYKDRYLRIKYEDFTEDPESTLKEIGQFLNVDFQGEISKLNEECELPIMHQISGNRLRSQKRIRLRTDNKWKEKIKIKTNLLFLTINYFFMKLYKYKI